MKELLGWLLMGLLIVANAMMFIKIIDIHYRTIAIHEEALKNRYYLEGVEKRNQDEINEAFKGEEK